MSCNDCNGINCNLSKCPCECHIDNKSTPNENKSNIIATNTPNKNNNILNYDTRSAITEQENMETLTPTKKFAQKFAKKKQIPQSEPSNANVEIDRKYTNDLKDTPQPLKQNIPASENRKSISFMKETMDEDNEYILKMEMKTNNERSQINNFAGKKLFSKYSPVVFKNQMTEEEKVKFGLITDYNYVDLKDNLNIQSKGLNKYLKSKSDF